MRSDDALMEDEETNTRTSSESKRRRHKQRQLLAELLSELDSLTDDEEEKEKSHLEGKVEKSSSSEADDEKMMKELNNIKRQNSITHYLLAASILVTLAWQLSEISLIFKIKQGLNNPLRSIGGVIKGLFRSSSPENSDQDAESQKQIQVIPQTYLPGLKIPDLPRLDLPGLETSNDDDDD